VSFNQEIDAQLSNLPASHPLHPDIKNDKYANFIAQINSIRTEMSKADMYGHDGHMTVRVINKS